MEKLRADWFDAPDLAAQKRICDDMQRLAHEVSGGLIVTLPGPDEDHRPELQDLDRLFTQQQ